MPVTDEQVAVLRAYLSGDFDTYEMLSSQIDRSAAAAGYSALAGMAFGVAVERRFGEEADAAATIDFVADVRSRSEGLASKIDPVVAERLIRALTTGERLDDIDRETRIRTRFLLLAALTVDENLDDAGLDSFLAEARKIADEVLYREAAR